MSATNLTYPLITNLYFYIPGRCTPLDIVCIKPDSTTPPTSDHYFGLVSKKTLTDYQNEYPSILMLTGEEVHTKVLQAARKPVTEINWDRYREMYEMPHYNWSSSTEHTMFMLSEHAVENITDICVSIFIYVGEYRYFTLRDYDTLTQREIVDKVMQYIYD